MGAVQRKRATGRGKIRMGGSAKEKLQRMVDFNVKETLPSWLRNAGEESAYGKKSEGKKIGYVVTPKN